MRVITRRINWETKVSATESYVSMSNLTPKIQEHTAETYIDNGTVTIFVPGTTAAITTIEWEKGLLEDFQDTWSRLVPRNLAYQHKFLWEENNAFSHVRASVLGQSLVVPVVNKRLTLGQFQQIVFVEFDNRARSRQVILQFMGEQQM
ncbi:MAG: secondary thiamine-phosphate synthase enzyme YjbQ [Dehalococcoidales bacterium]|nr:secondary thiamine-phosphate synthase enzyme YjbQ [Dehalococcoidales bacterium]